MVCRLDLRVPPAEHRLTTALMPPLCTAGYGLANGEWNFLAGGFYLFLINTALIALSTWLVVRYLRFPILHYVEPALERRYKRLSALLFLALLGPSGYIFYNIVQESRENAALQLFVQDNMEIPGNTVDLEINRDVAPPELEVSIYGSMVTAEQEEQWKQQLAADHPKFNLNLINNGINEADIEEIREQMEFMMSSFSDLTAKDRQIQQLNAELTLTSGRLRQLESKLLPAGIGSELYTICPNATRVRTFFLVKALRYFFPTLPDGVVRFYS